eukprot:TRINITY_DN12291_c0_g1_i1.p1 TRINITY_DN12291_c0_g1~~TRINITY_DN12291_c0_g1_i1.p1  ORF type:complete len:569 (+),score=167.39 TRINITY_DN12291_c0_g1_i1:108-1814(+)
MDLGHAGAEGGPITPIGARARSASICPARPEPEPPSAAAASPAAAAPPAARPSFTKKTQQWYSLADMLGLFAMSFSYGFIFNSLVVLVIPTEVNRLTPHKQSVWMSLIMGAGAVSQLGSPIVGAWSDHQRRRVSFLVYGTFACVAGIALFLAVSATNSMLLLLAAHVTTMIGLSIVYSMICALLNDCILPEQVGQGSGALAILGTVGSGCGYALFAFDCPLEYTYALYITSCVVCLGVCVLYLPPNFDQLLKEQAIAAHQLQSPIRDRKNEPMPPRPLPDDELSLSLRPAGAVLRSKSTAAAADPERGGEDDRDRLLSNGTPPPASAAVEEAARSTTTEVLLNAITFPAPSRHPDFMWACMSRLMFNSGLAAQVYMTYYFRDVQKFTSPTRMVSLVAVSSLVGCTIAALPSGMLSDRVGKKPVIYAGIGVCVSALLLFLLLGGGSEEESTKQFLCLGLYYGVGNIAYLSVDYALGVTSLPRHSAATGADPALYGQPVDAAKDLGLFSMSATLGSVIGQVLYGFVLDLYGQVNDSMTTYHPHGFNVAFGAAGLFFVVSGLSVKWIKCVS